jgi:hypothetical protein
MDKSRIRERLLSLEVHEFSDTREAYADYVAGAHVTTDAGAVDSQDQSQAVQSRNLSEAFDSPLHVQQHKLDLLERIDFGPKTAIKPGAVVRLDGCYFVISVATGPFDFDGHLLMGLSPEAPIYAELEGRRAGERFNFRGRDHVVQEVT